MVQQATLKRKTTRHGTRAGYNTAGCRCQPCRDAHAAYERHRYAQIKAGTWDGPVDPTQAMHWVRTLNAGGWSRTAIAAQSGASESVIAALLWDNYQGQRGTIAAYTAESILGVTWGGIGAVPDLFLVPSIGASRRIRALARVRYPLPVVAAAIGPHTSGKNLIRVHRDLRTTARRAREVAAVYDELVNTLGPSRSAEIRAEDKGWAAPWQWNGVDIDDPHAVPLLESCDDVGRAVVTLQDLDALASGGETAASVAKRLGVKLGTVRQACMRGGDVGLALLARLDRNSIERDGVDPTVSTKRTARRNRAA